MLIIISNGGDNSSGHSLGDVLKLAGESRTLVYTIGIFDEDDPDRNPNVLRRLARASGGEAFFSGQLVVAVCKRIARDICNQYTIGHLSGSEAQLGCHRTIRVAAEFAGCGKLFVRARSGYIAAGGESRPVREEGIK